MDSGQPQFVGFQVGTTEDFTNDFTDDEDESSSLLLVEPMLGGQGLIRRSFHVHLQNKMISPRRKKLKVNENADEEQMKGKKRDSHAPINSGDSADSVLNVVTTTDDSISDDDDSSEESGSLSSTTSSSSSSSAWESEHDQSSVEDGTNTIKTGRFLFMDSDSTKKPQKMDTFEQIAKDAKKSFKQFYTKITYPPGSVFYSQDLIQSQSHLQNSSIQFLEKLKQLVDNVEKRMPTTMDSTPKHIFNSNIVLSLTEYLQMNLDKVFHLYRSDNEGDIKYCQAYIQNIFDHFQSRQKRPMLTDHDCNNYYIFKLFEQLLHVYARLIDKLSSPQISIQFVHCIEMAQTLFPKFKMHLILLHERQKAHKHKKNANSCIQKFFDIYVSQTKTLEAHFNYSIHSSRSNRSNMSVKIHMNIDSSGGGNIEEEELKNDTNENHIKSLSDIDFENEFELCMKSLVALDLYMENYSPLNIAILQGNACYDIESEPFKWLDYAKANVISRAVQTKSTPMSKHKNKKGSINFQTTSSSSITNSASKIKSRIKIRTNEMMSGNRAKHRRKHVHGHHTHLSIDGEYKSQLCGNPALRISNLEEMYARLEGKYTFLRAKVAWVIGHSLLYHERNFVKCEKLFFEALFLVANLHLDNNEYFPVKTAMLTQLTTLILIDYSDVLLENDKYWYAIQTLELVIKCLHLRSENERAFSIIRKLCIKCAEKKDWKRAIHYYNLTLDTLRLRPHLNLTEFAYLSQAICSVQLKRNNICEAEMHLQNGIQTIYTRIIRRLKQNQTQTNVDLHHHNHKNSSSTADFSLNTQVSLFQNMDEVDICQLFEICEGEERKEIGNLCLLLANLYITIGTYLEVAIKMLLFLYERVFESFSRKIQIQLLMATAYFKNGEYAKVDKVIQDMILKSKHNYTNMLKSLDFIELYAMNMIKLRKFSKALLVLNKALENTTGKENFAEKAKLKYLQGLVLQSQCFYKISLRDYVKKCVDEFSSNKQCSPPALSTNYHHRRGGATSIDDMNIDQLSMPVVIGRDGKKIVSSLHDVQSAFMLAYHKSLTLRNNIMQAKCCLAVGETYLDILMEYTALPKNLIRNPIILPKHILLWLEINLWGYNKQNTNAVVTHCLAEIESPLICAIGLSSAGKDIGLLINSYISIAELNFLKNSHPRAKSYWKEALTAFVSCYRDSDDWIYLRRISRHERLHLFAVYGRILRLLICFENEFIADNINVLDSYCALEVFMVAQKDFATAEQYENDLLLLSTRSNRQRRRENMESYAAIISDVKMPPNISQQMSMSNSEIDIEQKNNIDADEEKKIQNTSDIDHEFENATVNVKKKDESGSETEVPINSNRKKNKNIKPTLTFMIENPSLQYRQQACCSSKSIYPLLQRFFKYNLTFDDDEKCKCDGGEAYLSELIRYHWKMKYDAKRFSEDTLDIRNDESLFKIKYCIQHLNVKCDVQSPLNREFRSWKINEANIFKLNRIVFFFHFHNLYKSGEIADRGLLHNPSFIKEYVSDMAFHDNDFIRKEHNPWMNHLNQRSQYEIDNLTIEAVNIHMLAEELSIPHLKLASISELLMCLDPQNILTILGAIFGECQIVIVSKERCRSIAIIDALFALLYPFQWQHICIPWLSPFCFELTHFDSSQPFVFGIADIGIHHRMLKHNQNAIIVYADTNNVVFNKKPLPFHPLPLRIKGKLTRAMFRLMSGLLRNSFHSQLNLSIHPPIQPPRRRENMNRNSKYSHFTKSDPALMLLTDPNCVPISLCSERVSWFVAKRTQKLNNNNTIMNFKRIINYQKEFCAAWVEILEQYRLFLNDVDAYKSADIKEKSEKRISRYAHPRYRKFLQSIIQSRMFKSFVCLRSLVSDRNNLAKSMFDDLVLRSLLSRTVLYQSIKSETKTEVSKMRVTSAKHHLHKRRCLVKFNPQKCTLEITPDKNYASYFKNRTHNNRQMNTNVNNRGRERNVERRGGQHVITVYLKADDYSLELDDDFAQKHPYIAPERVLPFGQKFEFKIKHKIDGSFKLRCENYYQLTRWIHVLRAHSMDTWSWQIVRLQ